MNQIEYPPLARQVLNYFRKAKNPSKKKADVGALAKALFCEDNQPALQAALSFLEYCTGEVFKVTGSRSYNSQYMLTGPETLKRRQGNVEKLFAVDATDQSSTVIKDRIASLREDVVHLRAMLAVRLAKAANEGPTHMQGNTRDEIMKAFHARERSQSLLDEACRGLRVADRAMEDVEDNMLDLYGDPLEREIDVPAENE